MQNDPRVDAYLATRPADQQVILEKLRRDVARLAPDADETISSGMPAFRLDGTFLLSYAGWKRHCSIYPIDDELLARHNAEVGAYTRTRGSLHFSAAKPLPDEVLVDIVRARVQGVRGDAGY